MQAAIGDDILTIEELEGPPSLKRGSAGFYTETLHPAGAENIPMINYVAKGKLGVGRGFKVKTLVVDERVENVKIVYK